MENITSYKSVLTIAGSDSGGCAGIQADIKSISACGAFAASVITATTAQNTKGVIDIHAIPKAHIAHQLDAVLSDISFGAIKIGMLHSAEVIQIVEEKLVEYNAKHIVLDPVMVATSGDALITDGAIARLKAFLPKATLITPNIPEAEILLGKKISTNTLSKAAKEIGKRYSVSVLLKGGHVSNTNNHVQDILYIVEDDTIVTITNPKIKTDHTHGTGCSLSSSIAAFLSLGESLESAVIKGCNYVNTAIFNGSNKQLGEGRGPINHFNL